MDTFVLILVITVALFFTYTNGFHDSPLAIATSVSTRTLTPRAALLMAAVMNVVGALLGSGVARTVSEGLIAAPTGRQGHVILLSALVGAIAWNMITWYLALPSSSSHALFGGMAGAALAGSGVVHWSGVLDKIVIPMFGFPLLGLIIGYFLMVLILWIFRRASPHRAKRRFQMAQTVSAAGMALGHGLQDAQKAMGVVVMALVIGGVEEEGKGVPLWVRLACAVMLALGTLAGGWRIMRTPRRRIVEIDPPQGFAGETTAASMMYTASFLYSAPISTTHVITSAIAGAGATRRFSAVRWGIAGALAIAWIITLPAAAGIAALSFWAIELILG